MSKTLTTLVKPNLIDTEWLVHLISEIRETTRKTSKYVMLEKFCFSIVRGTRSIKGGGVFCYRTFLEQDHAQHRRSCTCDTVSSCS